MANEGGCCDSDREHESMKEELANSTKSEKLREVVKKSALKVQNVDVQKEVHVKVNQGDTFIMSIKDSLVDTINTINKIANLLKQMPSHLNTCYRLRST